MTQQASGERRAAGALLDEGRAPASNDSEGKEKPMTSASTFAQANDRGDTGPPLRLLAEAVVALQHTLGCGDKKDNRALDQLERSVWLELRRVCTDRQEREHHIAHARGLVAAPGAPSCHHAARLMSLTAQALAHAITGADADERRRIESLASRCAETAERLQRIATEAIGSWRLCDHVPAARTA